MSELARRLADAARSPVLLVASDFDGTLAPIVSDPADAAADPRALVALKTLAGLPRTHVAIITGRALGDLVSRIRDPGPMHLIGSHGWESEWEAEVPLGPQADALFERLRDALGRFVRAAPGLRLEEKPVSVALHYREVPPDAARRVVESILRGPAAEPGVHVRHGKMVIELAVVDASKGAALQRLRRHVAASAVIFIGDDQTDEEAFAALSAEDLSIKVGPGETQACYRLADTDQVAELLGELARLRAGTLASGIGSQEAAATSRADEA